MAMDTSLEAAPTTAAVSAIRLVPETSDISTYLESSEIINWKEDPEILALAQQLAEQSREEYPEAANYIGKDTERSNLKMALIRTTFEWVRDTVEHCVHCQVNPVTCAASQVLRHRTGFCYSKAHLLAALLRANDIPTGLCYQRLCVNDDGQPPYCLHGLNAVCLSSTLPSGDSDGYWYRLDPRGDFGDVKSLFDPPRERLAYPIALPGERDFVEILSRPLPSVVSSLKQYEQSWEAYRNNLPDCEEESLTSLLLRGA